MPELTIHQLRVFATVLETGSLTAAAGAMDLPQPSVSRLVARLEQAVGTPLLERTGRGVSATPAGERFRNNAVRALTFHDLAIEEARAAGGELTGDVVLVAPDSVGGVLFAPLVLGLRSAHPRLRLRTIAAQSTAIPTMLNTGAADIGIVADTHGLPSTDGEPLFEEDLYLVGLRSAEVLRRPELPLDAIADLPLVLNAMPGGFRGLIDRAFAERGLQPNVRIEIDANNALVEMLLDGAGYGILPYSLVASALSSERLQASRLIQPALTRRLSVITSASRPSGAVLREILERVRAVVSAQASRARWRPLSTTSRARTGTQKGHA